MMRDAGAEWRTLEDTSNEPLISFRNPVSWASWQRNMFSAYSQGQMIWLEADAIIRHQSGQKKSLDDFARAFFSGDDAGDITRTYTLDDMIATLQSIQPYEWREFFDSRVREYGPGRLAHSIERSGYRVVFSDQPSPDEQSSKTLNLIDSLGMRVSPTGCLYEVQWNGPAFQASLTGGETIASVNGQPYKPDLLVQAIKQATAGGPIDLTVKRGASQQTTSIHWTGGMRYPHLERVEEHLLCSMTCSPRGLETRKREFLILSKLSQQAQVTPCKRVRRPRNLLPLSSPGDCVVPVAGIDPQQPSRGNVHMEVLQQFDVLGIGTDVLVMPSARCWRISSTICGAAGWGLWSVVPERWIRPTVDCRAGCRVCGRPGAPPWSAARRPRARARRRRRGCGW